MCLARWSLSPISTFLLDLPVSRPWMKLLNMHSMHTKASNKHTSECRSGDTIYCRCLITENNWLPSLTMEVSSLLLMHVHVDVSALISCSDLGKKASRIGWPDFHPLHAWRFCTHFFILDHMTYGMIDRDDWRWDVCVRARAFVSSLIRHSGLVDLPPWNCNVEELAWSLFHWLF